jgi:hypothetical protein
MTHDIRARIAKTLGWTQAEVGQFSLPSLHALVRPVDPKLAAELAEVIAGRKHWTVPSGRSSGARKTGARASKVQGMGRVDGHAFGLDWGPGWKRRKKVSAAALALIMEVFPGAANANMRTRIQDALAVDGDVRKAIYYVDKTVMLSREGHQMMRVLEDKLLSSKEPTFAGAASGSAIIAYHGGPVPIRKFSATHGAQGVMWFSEDRKKIERGTSGAASTRYIMTVKLKVNKVAGWDDYERLMLGQIFSKTYGFDAIRLDQGEDGADWVLRDPKRVEVIAVEERPVGGWPGAGRASGRAGRASGRAGRASGRAGGR